MVRLTAAVLAGLAVLLGGSTAAHSRPLAPSFMQMLLRVGGDGTIHRGERMELGQRGLDKIAIAQVVTQTRDGARLTRPEAETIIKAFVVRANRNAPDPLIAICKQSPLYPPCKNR